MSEIEKKEPEKQPEGGDFLQPAVPNKNFELISVLKIVGVIFILVIIGVGFALYSFKEENKFVKTVANIIPFPLALVDYQPILMSNYWQELDVVLNACQQVGTDCQISALDREQVTNGLVKEKVVDKIARQEGIEVTAKEVDDEYNKIVQENGGAEVFLKLLEEQFKWSVDELKERIYYDLLSKKLQDEKIEQVKASHILITFTADASEEEINKAKEKAQGVLDRIKNGEDFAVIAGEVSEDPGSAKNGGDLGFFARGAMVPEFEQAAFALSAGQVSDLIKTQYGWHIIKVIEKKNTIQLSFQDWIQEEQNKMNVWILYKKS